MFNLKDETSPHALKEDVDWHHENRPTRLKNTLVDTIRLHHA